MRVLIADDNRLMLEGVRRALEPVEDFEIVGATHTGPQVLPLVERRPGPTSWRSSGGCAARDGGAAALGAPARRARPTSRSSCSPPRPRTTTSARGAHQRRRAYIVKSVDPLDIPAALRHAYDETVQPRDRLRAQPEDQLRAAGLTKRDCTVLKALARGLSDEAISGELWVSEETVVRLGDLYRKLGVPNRLAAANIAHARGIAVA